MVPWCSTHQTADEQHAGLAPLEPIRFHRMFAGQHRGINARQLRLADGCRQPEVILVGLPRASAYHHRLLAPLEAFEHQLEHGQGLRIVVADLRPLTSGLRLGVRTDVPQDGDLLAGLDQRGLAFDVLAVQAILIEAALLFAQRDPDVNDFAWHHGRVAGFLRPSGTP